MSENNKKLSFSERARATKILIELLASAKFEQVLTYKDLTRSIGLDVQGKARHNLGSARKIVERENRILFSTVPKVGIKRLLDNEIYTAGVETRRVFSRKARRTALKLECVDSFGSMSPIEQNRLNGERTLNAMQQTVSSDRAVRRIGAKVAEERNVLVLAQTLDEIRKL